MTEPGLEVGDRLAVHELVALYGHLVDEQRWDELDRVFTDDVVYDATDFGMPITRGIAELVAEWTSEVGMTRHPLAHHTTNVVVEPGDDGRRDDGRVDSARVLSKGIGVGPGGRVGSVTYWDEVVRTPAGWRISSRTVELRRPARG